MSRQRNEVREGVLRGARATTGQEGQDTRISGARPAHVSRGSFINYYDDLGISTTPTGAGQIRKEEADFQSKVATQQGIINQKRAEVNSAYAAGQQKIADASSKIPKLPGLSEALSTSWNKTKSSFTPITVVSGKDNKTEGTYRLPKEVATKLAAEKGLYTNWGPDGTFYVSANVKGGRVVGAELHEALGKAQKDVYSQWYDSALPTISKQLGLSQSQVAAAKGQIASASSQLSGSYSAASSQLAEAEGVLAGLKSNREAQWKELRDNYQKRKDTIASIFSNLKVEEAEEKK